MQKITYLAPKTIEEAIAYLDRYAGVILPYAGGTDIMVQLRENSPKVTFAEYFLDLQYLSALKGITDEGDRLRIGAGCTHREIAESELVRKFLPMLSQASSQVGSPQIRAMGTIGGNVGNGSPAADTLSALAALRAAVEICGPKGSEIISLEELFQRRAHSVSGYPEGQIIISFLLDKLEGYTQAFTKLGRRKALAISRLNVSAALKVENGIISDARIAPGCVFRTPMCVRSAEELLIGQEAPVVTDIRGEVPGIFHAAACEVAEEVNRKTGIRWSTEYKQPALIAVVEETLMKAASSIVF